MKIMIFLTDTELGAMFYKADIPVLLAACSLTYSIVQINSIT